MVGVVSLRTELLGHTSVQMKTKYWLHFYTYELCYMLSIGVWWETGKLTTLFPEHKTKSRNFSTYGKAFVHTVLGVLTLACLFQNPLHSQILMHCLNSLKNY